MGKDPLELRPENRLAPEAGRLLVSEPFLTDPYFRRSVILLCEHNADGSFGLVLNRYVDLKIHEIMDGFPAIETRLCIGGPVQSGNLFYLHTLGERIEGSVKVLADVRMGGDFEQLRDMLNADMRLAKHVRFFIGYSGWEKGQLERELAERSWLVTKADKKRVMNSTKEDIWADTLRSMGKEFAPLANFPDDPTLN